MRWIAGTVLALYLLILLFAHFGPAQSLLTEWAEQALEEKLQTRVDIGRIEIGLFNRLTLHDVCLYDREDRPLLRGGLISAKIAFAPLLEGEVSLRSVSLLDATVNLRRDRRDGPTNFAFVLEAFRSKKQDRPSKLNLRINSLILRRCAVSYDEAFRPRTPGRFNTTHLSLREIDANISLKRITPDSLNLRVRHIALREQSGFEVRDLSFRLAAGRRGFALTRFRLRLPGSEITERELYGRYNAADPATLLRTLRLDGVLNDAVIATADFAAFSPAMRRYRRRFFLTGGFSVSPGAVSLRSLNMNEEHGNLALSTDVDLTRSDGKISAVRLRLKHFSVKQEESRTLLTDLIGKDDAPWMSRLGDIHLSGDADYLPEGRSRAKINIETLAGTLALTAYKHHREVSAQVASTDFSPARWLGREDLPAHIDFHLDGQALLHPGTRPDIRLTACLDRFTLRERNYHNIQATASWIGHKVKADIASSDDVMKFTARTDADFDGHLVSNMQFEAFVDRLSLAATGISSRYGEDLLSGQIFLKADRLSADMREAHLQVQHLKKTGLDGLTRYHLDHLDLQLTPRAGGGHLHLDSDFARADYDGPMTAAFLREYLDEWLNVQQTKRLKYASAGSARFVMQLRKTDFLSEILHFPLTLDGPLTAEGTLGTGGERSSMILSTAGFDFKGISADNVRLYMTGKQGSLNALLQANKRIGNTDMKIEVDARTEADDFLAALRWDDGKIHRYAGELSTKSRITKRDNGALHFETDVLPTRFALGDTIWQVHGGRFSVDDTGLTADGFRVTNADRSIRIDGRTSGESTDSMMIDLHRVNLAYILSLVNLRPVSLAGDVTGRIRAGQSPEGGMMLTGRLDIPHFLFNDADLGRADIQASFNLRDKRLTLDADMREESLSRTQVKGYVGIGEKALDLHVTSRNTRLEFLRRYLSGLFGDISGRTSGVCRIHGPFSTIDFEGLEHPDIHATVLATGVRYQASGGTVRLTDGVFDFSAFNLADGRDGRGRVDGIVHHEHLKNVRYDFTASTTAMKLYDRSRTDDLPFGATVYGDGNAHLTGRPGMMTLDLDMTPTAGSELTYLIDTPESYNDISLLRFTDRSKVQEKVAASVESDSSKTAPATSETDMILNFQVAMNPTAALRVIMDERTGDYILLRGNGALRAGFYNKTGFRMYGIYNVERGSYKMSIQDVIRKDFNFLQGGSITFAGNPFDADLDLRAVYTVPSVSLSDLGLGLNVSNGTVRANCELSFTGKVGSPQVKFGLGLPTVSDEVKYMVNQLIATEEEMNTQVIYLLGVGRFSPINYAATESAAEGQSQSGLAMKSFLSSTLSSQLNSILSEAINSNNWTFGTNLSTGAVGWSDMEVEGLLSGRLLNNRLLINGNFGYRDRATSSSNFVGDFDISYLLTPAGGVSLKAYSETNDRYFSKTSMTTQGIGLLVKRDFNRLSDLFFWRKKKKAF